MNERELLEQILNTLKNTNKEPTLWNVDDIAKFFKTSKSTAVQRIISDSQFPKAISVNRTSKRWKPDEVMRFAERNRV